MYGDPHPTEMSFLEAHLKYLMEDARRTPKLQLERAVGPLLTHFIARAMSALTLSSENAELAGQYRLICCEFPLKKYNNQSTNIDWLLLNEMQGSLVFLELKTDANSIRKAQIFQYWSHMSGTADLWGAVEVISGKSRQKAKYKHILEKLEQHGVTAQTFWPVKLVFLAPKPALLKVPPTMQNKIHRISFSELPVSINGEFAEQWSLIRSYLEQLDHSVRGQ